MNNQVKTRFTDRITGSGFYKSVKEYFDRNGYLFCSFIIPFALLWMAFIIMRVYPFGSGSALVLDMNGQYVYFFEALRKAIYGDASLLYSWSRSLGGEFLGIYAYYIASPISYIVALFPETNMTEAILTINLIKCGLCGGTMAYYLRKTRPNSNEMLTIMISVMYALSSYAVIHSHNTMWIDALIWLPLLVLGIERLIKEHKFILFTVSLAMTVISTFYIGYMVCIFVAIYFFYYYFAGSDGENNLCVEKRHFIKSLMRIAIASAIALMIACIIILPTYYSLKFGKTTFSNPDWTLKTKLKPLEFIAKTLFGSYDTVRPEGLPFLFCGMLTLITVPLFFISKKITLRKKIGGGIVYLILSLSMMFTTTDLIWHGMQKPNWLNYRYSFLLIFMALVFAHQALENLEHFNKKHIYISAGFVGTLIILVTVFRDTLTVKDGYKFVNYFYCIIASVAITAIYTVLLLLYLKRARARQFIITAISVAVCIEMLGNGIANLLCEHDDVTFSPKYTSSASGLEGYNDFLDRMRAIVNPIQAADTSFYRMENSDIRKVCDNHALLMRGISGSTSTLNAKTIRFLHQIGYTSASHASSYKGGTPVTDALLGIKYTLSANERNTELLNLFDSSQYMTYNGTIKNMYAYLNENALSVAYSSTNALVKNDYANYNSPFELTNDIVTGVLGANSQIKVFKELPYSFTYTDTVEYKSIGFVKFYYDKYGNVTLKADGTEDKRTTQYHSFTTADVTQVAEVYFTFTVPETLTEDTEVFFSIPSYYSRKVKWECNGKTGDFFGDSDCILSLGTLEPGKEYKMTFTLQETAVGSGKEKASYIDSSCGMFYYVDKNVYEESFNAISEGNFVITEYTEDMLYGTVNATAGRTTMFTTIPYDEGWNITVDGKAVEPQISCGSLLAFDLGSEGKHTVKLQYFPKVLKQGLIISATGVFIFAALIVCDITIFSKKRAVSLEKYEIEREKKKNKQQSAKKNNK